jgi:hypothetical protein
MSAKTMSAVAAAVLFSLVAIAGATAGGGCGPGFHRNAFGRCRPNGPVVGASTSCREDLRCKCLVQQCWDMDVGTSPARAACIAKCVAANKAAQH